MSGKENAEDEILMLRERIKDLEEQNLKTVILLNPKNEEAVYNLALLKKRKSNYTETKKLTHRHAWTDRQTHMVEKNTFIKKLE